MSFVIATPEFMTAAATDLSNIGSAGPAPVVGLPAETASGERWTGSQRAQGLGVSER
jgi:hypothetical protein